MRSLIPAHGVKTAGMGREEPQYDPRQRINETVVAVVARVYPVGHPDNELGQTAADLVFSHSLPPALRVPLSGDHAHQETGIATPDSANRQPYAPKGKNRIEGRAADVRPGTKVLVTFINGDLRSPVIIGKLRFNEQGDGGKAELATIDVFGTNGKQLDLSVINPLDSAMAEYPRDIDGLNGSRRVIDNRGNYHIQTSDDVDPVFPGHNGIPAAPKPEGNYGVSTRGARVGNIGLLTGKSDVTGQDSRGTIRLETAKALVGDLIARLHSKSGRLFISTEGSDAGTVYVQDKQGSYVALRANGVAEMHGETKGVIDADDVRLGHANAPFEIVLWPQLDEIVTDLCSVFDGHGHTEVESGNSVSGPPNNFQSIVWLRRRTECRADGVYADKSPSASPEKETDPDGD